MAWARIERPWLLPRPVLTLTAGHRRRLAGGFNFGVASELNHHSERLPATAMIRIIMTTIIRTAIFAVFLRALKATYAAPASTRKNATATIAPIIWPVG